MSRAFAITVVAFLSCGIAAQEPIFRARTELVRVDVLVTGAGRPVRDLTLEDFEVRDEGIVQQLEFMRFEQLPLNVLLVCDMSLSLSDTDVRNVQAAGRAVLANLRQTDRAGLVTFGDRVTEQQRLTDDHAAVGAALSRLTPSGVTPLADAVFAGVALASNEAGRSVVFVFSDGVDTASWFSHERVLQAVKASPATVYAASVRAESNQPFNGDLRSSQVTDATTASESVRLRELAETSGGRYLNLESTGNLEAAFAGFLAEFRERYVLGYTPESKPTASRWHRLDVRVKRRNVTVLARPGYLSRPEQP